MKSKKIKKLNNLLGKLSLNIAQHAFVTCLFLFFLALILGGLLFYKYSILSQKKYLEGLDWGFSLEEDAYQQVIKTWQVQDRKFQEADFKEYPDPFKKQGLTE